jgi:hypothetical protein
MGCFTNARNSMADAIEEVPNTKPKTWKEKKYRTAPLNYYVFIFSYCIHAADNFFDKRSDKSILITQIERAHLSILVIAARL